MEIYKENSAKGETPDPTPSHPTPNLAFHPVSFVLTTMLRGWDNKAESKINHLLQSVGSNGFLLLQLNKLCRKDRVTD